MMNRTRFVAVRQVPAVVDLFQERSFLSELRPFLETERPRLVLDCSRVREMDTATMHLLLSCLEEVMKRNGDVKLASLSATAETKLDVSGLTRLFEVFDTTMEAERSFQSRSSRWVSAPVAIDGLRESESAA
jgi:anti-sigma B factor antagonist